MQTKDEIYKAARELTDRVNETPPDDATALRDALFDLCGIVASLAAIDGAPAPKRKLKK
jgi:hypothetical protein